MRKQGFLLAAGLLITAGALAWAPPAQPDLRKILREAKDDAMSGRLDEAAAKHRWYHENALRIDPAHSGVRLSFALSDWHELAERHLPAMRDLLAARDAAAGRLARAQGEEALKDYLEYVRIESMFARWESIQAEFQKLATRQPAIAPKALRHALPALVVRGEHQLALRHLQAELLLERYADWYRSLSEDMPGKSEYERKSMRAMAWSALELECARPVWVLAKSGRRAEAEQFAGRCRHMLGGGSEFPFIDGALEGRTPPALMNQRGPLERFKRWLYRLFG